MLLSRVADALFWAGRYLERSESTARVVATHTELFLDLPKAAGLTWSPLLAVTGGFDQFDSGHVDRSEEHVVGFLLADPDNAGSIVSSLGTARDNIRTTRGAFPREAWELLNALHQAVEQQCSDAISRRNRLPFLHQVIGQCQQLTGLLAGSMADDEAYAFFRMGRHIERADMTTRVLDVRAGMLLHDPTVISPYADVLWMGVLKAVGAEHAYRRQGSARVKGSSVLRFLLQDPSFPRSVDHCLAMVTKSVSDLPSPESVLARCLTAQYLVDDARVRSLAWDGLGDYVDELQRALHDIHRELEASYFSRRSDANERQPQSVGTLTA